MEEQKPNTLLFKLKRFVIECLRVIRVTKKPTNIEFRTVVKVTGLGILLIGFIGFLLTITRQLLFK